MKGVKNQWQEPMPKRALKWHGSLSWTGC